MWAEYFLCVVLTNTEQQLPAGRHSERPGHGLPTGKCKLAIVMV
jgi:hypothetical protein